MRVARISIAEFKTEEGVTTFVNDYADQFDTNFPNSEGSAMVRTGPRTLMNFIVYPNDEAVEDSYKVRTKFMDSRKELLVQDETFYYEGEVIWAKLFNAIQDQPKAKGEESKLDSMQEQITELKDLLSEVLAKLPS